MQRSYRDVRLRRRWSVIRCDSDLDNSVDVSNPENLYNEFDSQDTEA